MASSARSATAPVIVRPSIGTRLPEASSHPRRRGKEAKMLKEKSALAPSRNRSRSTQVSEAKLTPEAQFFLKRDPIAEFSQAFWMVLREWFGDFEMRSEICLEDFSTLATIDPESYLGTCVSIGENFPMTHLEFIGFRVRGVIPFELPEGAVDNSPILAVLKEANQGDEWRTVDLQVSLVDGIPVVTHTTPPANRFDSTFGPDDEWFAAWRAQNQKVGAEVAELA